MNPTMSPDYAGDQLWIPNIVRAISQAMVLTPLTSMITGDIAPQDMAAASGISNMLRNLGGAIGAATRATVITKCEQFHSNVIGQSVTLGREKIRARIETMSGYFTPPVRRNWLLRASRQSSRSARSSGTGRL
jgi:DHA2 family multidrug resistance protein